MCFFFNSPYYFFSLALIILGSNFWGLEIYAFTLLALFALACMTVSEDNKPLIPIYLYYMMAFSTQNSAIFNPDIGAQNVFSWEAIYCLSLAAVVACGFIFHFFLYQSYRRVGLLKKGKFVLAGIAVLLVGQMLAGIGSPDYTAMGLVFNLFFIGTILFGFLFLTLTCFTDGTDPIKYLVQCAVLFELLMFAQLGYIFLTGENVIIDGVINKSAITNGWGSQNNFAGFLCMMLPFNIYGAKKYRRGWLQIIMGLLTMVATIVTESRTGILFAGCLLIFGIVYLIIPVKKKFNILNIITIGVILLICGIIVIIFREQIKDLFQKMINMGFDDNGRDELFTHGMETFNRNPIFGGGFYSLDALLMPQLTGNYIVPKWFYHNLIIQYLAANGIVGLVLFIAFFILISIQVIKNPTTKKTFIYFSFIALIAMSFFDVFFFLFHFVRFYGLIFGLMVAESGDIRANKARSKKLKA